MVFICSFKVSAKKLLHELSCIGQNDVCLPNHAESSFSSTSLINLQSDKNWNRNLNWHFN